RLGEADHPRLRRAIGSDPGRPFLSCDRGDVDNPAVAVPAHMRYSGAAAVEDAGEIGRDDAVPCIERIARDVRDRTVDSGIVDQDLDPAKLARSDREGALDR